MIGETFGNYRLVRRIGSGTMGTVFLGEHERIVRRAAIKVLAPELALAADILGRFFEEARATSLIQHPAIVEVLDCGIHPDGRRPYIAMEYLEGDTLAAHLAGRGRLGWRDACGIAWPIAEGLAAAHRHGIVHRDVKPANVMLLTADPAAGPAARPVAAPRDIKLLDFGVAKLLREAQSKVRTCPGGLLGTPEYMAPEQCGGAGSIDGRTDIYALGCVLFEMVCGRLPFQGEMIGELIFSHRWREAPPASAFAEVPRPLERLIAKMLAKHPEHRPPDMPHVAQALREVVAPAAPTAIVVRAGAQPGAATRARRAGRKHSRTVIATLAGIAAVIAIGAQLARAGRRTRHPHAPVAAAPIPAPVWAAAPPPPLGPSRPSTLTVPPERPSRAAAPSPRTFRPAAAARRPRSTPEPEIDTDGIVHL